MSQSPRDAKKILFLTSSMEGGGAERVAATLCSHWASLGHDVTLMPTFSGRGSCIHTLHREVKLEFLADRVGVTGKNPLILLKRFFALRSAIKEVSPDVVVSFLTHVNVAALLASRGLGVPVVVSERTYPPKASLPAILLSLRRKTYRWAKCVVAQTSDAADWIKANCPGAVVEVIQNPVLLPLPRAEPILLPDDSLDQGRRVILAVGRLVELKGFDQLIEAFSKLGDEALGWDLVILGEGRWRAELESQVRSLGLERRVHLPGRAGNAADWYDRAELFVMSSLYEGFPNALLEAMAHGTAVVSYDCPVGPKDIVRSGTDGILVPLSAGSEGLAEAMARLIADEPLRARMGASAKDVCNRFSMFKVSQLWSSIL